MRHPLAAPAVTCLVIAAVTACATAPAVPPTPRLAPEEVPSMRAGTVCDPEGFAERPEADRAVINEAFAAEPRLTEIRVTLHAPQALVRQRVTAAMLACDMPVSSSTDGVITADYGGETGLIGQYELTAHAAVVAVDHSTTLVRLYGREQSKRGNVFNPSVNTGNITNKNMGRSLRAWITLRNVAKQLRADPDLRANIEASTALGLLYAR